MAERQDGIKVPAWVCQKWGQFLGGALGWLCGLLQCPLTPSDSAYPFAQPGHSALPTGQWRGFTEALLLNQGGFIVSLTES